MYEGKHVKKENEYSEEGLPTHPVPPEIDKIAMAVFEEKDKVIAKKNSSYVNSIKAWYYRNPTGDELAVIVNDKGERLIADSSIQFEQHLQDYLEGKRN